MDCRIKCELQFRWARWLYGCQTSMGRFPQGCKNHSWQNKGTVRFNITDIFWTNLPNAVITYPGKYIEKWHAFRESRVGTLHLYIQVWQEHRTGRKKKNHRIGRRKTKSASKIHIWYINHAFNDASSSSNLNGVANFAS